MNAEGAKQLETVTQLKFHLIMSHRPRHLEFMRLRDHGATSINSTPG